MKEFTAQEARDMVNNSGVVSRETRSVLRDIKRAAKRGRCNLSVSYSRWDDMIAAKICENLGELGYKARLDLWRPIIYISWSGEE